MATTEELIAEEALQAIKRGGVEVEPNWKEAFRQLYYEHKELLEALQHASLFHSVERLGADIKRDCLATMQGTVTATPYGPNDAGT